MERDRGRWKRPAVLGTVPDLEPQEKKDQRIIEAQWPVNKQLPAVWACCFDRGRFPTAPPGDLSRMSLSIC